MQWVQNGSCLNAVGMECVTPQCSGYGMGHTSMQWVWNGSHLNAVGMEWVTPQCSGYGMGHLSMQWVWNGSRLGYLNAVGAAWVIIMPVLPMMFFPGNQERCHKIV